jgi:hypothetical protein
LFGDPAVKRALTLITLPDSVVRLITLRHSRGAFFARFLHLFLESESELLHPCPLTIAVGAHTR